MDPDGKYAHPSQGRFCYGNDEIDSVLRMFGKGWSAVLWVCYPEHFDPMKKVAPEQIRAIKYNEHGNHT